jgi:hypothetical protein
MPRSYNPRIFLKPHVGKIQPILIVVDGQTLSKYEGEKGKVGRIHKLAPNPLYHKKVAKLLFFEKFLREKIFL